MLKEPREEPRGQVWLFPSVFQMEKAMEIYKMRERGDRKRRLK